MSEENDPKQTRVPRAGPPEPWRRFVIRRGATRSVSSRADEALSTTTLVKVGTQNRDGVVETIWRNDTEQDVAFDVSGDDVRVVK
jgi:hypothetical protein